MSHTENPEEIPTHVDESAVRRKTFWSRFGGDGFLISLAVHIVLAIIAIFWVVTTLVDKKTDDPDVFATGAGGGTDGDRAKIFEHRIKPKNARNMVSTPTKIVAKGASSVSLPDMPKVNMAAMLSGNLAGGSSKGMGGGSGGGIGTGQGVGRGGGRNMVSLFGMSGGFGANAGMIGTFYDFKKTTSGDSTDMAPDTGESRQAYVDKVREFTRRGFREDILKDYFQSPEKLVATQIYIPPIPADAAPKAFNVPNVAPSRWLIHYKGAITAPKSGRFRFVGSADDIIAAYWNGRAVFDGGHDFVTEIKPSYTGTGHMRTKDRVPNSGTGRRPSAENLSEWGNTSGGGLRMGSWITVVKGNSYNIDVVLGETPGGEYSGYLMFEEAETDTSSKGSGKLALFRIGDAPLPEEISRGGGRLRCDMSGGGWIWQPALRRAAR